MAAIVFDLDGTLVESVTAIRDIANAYMRARGLAELSTEETRRYIGRGSPIFLERALKAREAYDATTFDEEFARLHVLYENAPPDANPPMPGAVQAMHDLIAGGHVLGLCTNKPFAPTEKIVKALGWSDLFGAVAGGDSLPERKPHPAPLLHVAKQLGQEAAIYVGDSEVDAATAEAAEMPFLFYTEGYCNAPVDELTIAARFSDFSVLPALVAQHVG